MPDGADRLDRPPPPAEDAAPMVHALARSSLVLTGLLLLGVGLGNFVAGQSKIRQYEELLVANAPIAQPDPAALFPAASERTERHALAGAKLAFYQLLVTVGVVLSAAGLLLLGVGTLRVWVRAARAPADLSAAN